MDESNMCSAGDHLLPDVTEESLSNIHITDSGKVKPPINGHAKKHTPADPKGVGMSVGYKQLYSGDMDNQGRFIWQAKIPEDIGKFAEDAESEKWAIIVRRIRAYGDPKRVLALHSIVIQSPFLKKILQEVLKGYPGVTTSLQHLEFTGRFEPLIHRWAELRATIADLQEKHDVGDQEAGERIQHVKLLDDLLAAEFSKVEEAMVDMKKNGVITFADIWTIFPPDLVIFARKDNQDRALRLQDSSYGFNSHNQPVFCLTASYIDFDGQRFGIRKVIIVLHSFEGTRRISSLAAFPIELHDNHEQIKEKLIERGARVEALAGSYFKSYNGIGWRYDDEANKQKHTVKGRVVIDPFGFNQFEPDHAVYVAPLNKVQVAAIPPGGLCDQARHMAIPASHGYPPLHPQYIDPGYFADSPDVDDGGMPADGFFNGDGNGPKREALTDDQKLICTPMVRGYALKEKEWLYFFVNAIADISFNERAFESLSLPRNQKDRILGLTSVKQSYRSQFDDVIEGKGKGFIILLSGPPGVGKTLSAESVAEQMKVPLYTMAAGELGLDAKSVEKKLQDAMSMCSRWGAILLLDEADIFLQERSLHELYRNKLVSVFLRALEYYEGIMFLTTNRLQTFDAAFQSRIHISLEYPELDKPARKAIWQNFLHRHNVAQAAARDKPATDVPGAAKLQLPLKSISSSLAPDAEATTNGDANDQDEVKNKETEELRRKLTQPHQINDDQINELADLKINGRQIKNFLKTAQLLSVYKEEPLRYDHLETVVATTQHLHKAIEATNHARGAIYH